MAAASSASAGVVHRHDDLGVVGHLDVVPWRP